MVEIDYDKVLEKQEKAAYVTELERKAAAFDVLVKHGWFVEQGLVDRGKGRYVVRKCGCWAFSTGGYALGFGDTAVEAVENAEDLWSRWHGEKKEE